VAAPAYSTRFLAVFGQSGNFNYVVPSGQVAVVRCADVVITSTSSGNFALMILNIAAFWYIPANTWSAESYAHWEGRQVLGAGETLQVQLPSASHFACSGYLLSAA
jgi:hypothetical protein